MRARTVLTILLVGALASAGCLGTGSPATATESPTGSPTTIGSPTTTTTASGFEDATFADGPMDAPDRPDSLGESAVREYVRTFEHNRVYNLLWMGEGTDVTLDCKTHAVEPVDGGYDVLVSCTGYSNSDGSQSSDSTTTEPPVHSDWFTQYFVYRVTEDGDERRRATEDERSSGSL